MLIVSLRALRKEIFPLDKKFKHWQRKIVDCWLFPEKRLLLVLVLLLVWLFGRALFFNQQRQLIAGDRLVWTDWPVHTGIAANFAWGNNFPPQNPFFSGIPLIYPFMADFLSGVLLALNVAYPLAFILPAIVLIASFFLLFIFLIRRLFSESQVVNMTAKTKPYRLAILALLISLFWGGMGFVYWLKESFADETVLVERLISPPREYTFWHEKGLWFFTFLYSEILPQRAFLFGLPIFFLILILLKLGWDKGDKGGEKHFLTAGLLSGLLPFFHTHTYISIVILSVSWVVVAGLIISIKQPKFRKRYLKAIFLYFLALGGMSLIQLPWFLSQNNQLPFEFGWMKGNENFFWFWFKNTGFFWPLAFLGFWKGKFSGFVKTLAVASWSLFLLPNLFRFAPWGYDNLKILTYWYLINSMLVITGLLWLWQKKLAGKIIAGLLFMSLIFSGLVEVARIIPTSRVQIGLWSDKDFQLAKSLRQKTEPKAIFLTATIHDHPVTAFAGRKIVIGFPGNMWSWGIVG